MKLFKKAIGKIESVKDRFLEPNRPYQPNQVDHHQHQPQPANNLSQTIPNHAHYPAGPPVCQMATNHNFVHQQSTLSFANAANQIRSDHMETVQNGNPMIIHNNLPYPPNHNAHMPMYYTSQSVPVQPTAICNTNRMVENTYSNQQGPIATNLQQQTQIEQMQFQLQHHHQHQYHHTQVDQYLPQHGQACISNYVQLQIPPAAYHDHPAHPAPQQQQAQAHQDFERQSTQQLQQKSQLVDIRQHQSQIVSSQSHVQQQPNQQQFMSQGPKIIQYAPIQASIQQHQVQQQESQIQHQSQQNQLQQQQQYQNYNAMKKSADVNEELSLEVILMMYEKSKKSLLERGENLRDDLEKLNLELDEIRKEMPAYVVKEAEI